MDRNRAQTAIASGETVLGIELGSTRIKAVLIDAEHAPLASGSYAWENSYENGVWTYPLDEVWTGVQESYRHPVSALLCRNAKLGALGNRGNAHAEPQRDNAPRTTPQR